MTLLIKFLLIGIILVYVSCTQKDEVLSSIDQEKDSVLNNKLLHWFFLHQSNISAILDSEPKPF